MGLKTRAVLSEGIDSFETGTEIGCRILDAFGGEKPAILLHYATVLHDQRMLLDGIRRQVGDDVPLLGCSTQGVVGRRFYVEDGYAAGTMALGGSSLRAAVARQEDIQIDSRQKGTALGRSLVQGLSERPKLVILHYDPLCGVDIDVLLGGFFDEVQCPIIGAAAGQPYGPGAQTFQYFGNAVFGRGAVATALTGDWIVETDICHGASPVGVELTVTKVRGPILLELDGRPALEVWEDITGAGPASPGVGASLAVGLPSQIAGADPWLVRAAYGVNFETKGVVLAAELPVGTSVMLHHRTTQGVLHRTAQMTQRLQERIKGRSVRAVLGFECGARTKPFLGTKLTRQENLELQNSVPDGDWLGMLPWGEVYSTTGQPVFHNYAYMVIVLAE